MRTEAATPRELCDDVKDVCAGEFNTLTARPWNRFEPDASLWWLVPSTDWPAYRYGKLYFDWLDKNDFSVMSCGLHVERGARSPSSICVSVQEGHAVPHGS